MKSSQQNWLVNKFTYQGDQFYTEDLLPVDTLSYKPRLKTRVSKFVSSKRFKAFNEMKEKAKKCSICSKTVDPKKLVIDHCHTSRKIRGVLCINCNHGLGKFLDSPKLLKKAIEYLNNFEKEKDKALDYVTLKGPENAS